MRELMGVPGAAADADADGGLFFDDDASPLAGVRVRLTSPLAGVAAARERVALGVATLLGALAD